MNLRTLFPVLFALLVCAVLVWPPLGARPAWAQSASISVDVSQGKLINLTAPASSVFIADPSIADVQVPAPNKVFIFGKKAGHTNLFALDANGGQIANLPVDVTNNADRAQGAVNRTPEAGGISVRSGQTGLVMEGSTPTPDTAADASRTATDNLGAGGKLDDRLKVRDSVQVMLKVKIAEVSRSVTKELGFNWNFGASPGAFGLGVGTGRDAIDDTTGKYILPSNAFGSVFGQVSTKRFKGSTVIDAMAEEGLITVLAEPTLISLSGQPASFLVGGEFPIPIAQSGGSSSGSGTGSGNTITVEFKQYGVSLNFVPTVLASNRINLHVRPEVSQLTTDGAISLNGLTIDALQVRRADTTVELGSGQSFAIGGLLQSGTTTDIQRYPGLGDLPILGALFRSSSFKRNETELIIIVTPYIVKPIDDPSQIKLPTDGFKPPSDLDLMYFGRSLVRDASPNVPHLVGSAGFELE